MCIIWPFGILVRKVKCSAGGFLVLLANSHEAVVRLSVLVDVRLGERQHVVLHRHALGEHNRGMDSHGFSDDTFQIWQRIELIHGRIFG